MSSNENTILKMSKVYKYPAKINFEDIINGSVLLINKPIEWTSFDLIRKFRYTIKDFIREHEGINYPLSKIKKIKIGHAGTLDPFAEGLMIIATGKYTKEISSFQLLNKIYEGKIIIGKKTSSYDSNTPFVEKNNIEHIKIEDIYYVQNKFIGEIDQIPPIYSAVKIDGLRAYKHARQGNIVDLKSKKVIINSFEILEIDLPIIKFKIECSKGTYIRSIANDFGDLLGVGAYLNKLKRLGVGIYELKDAYNIIELKNFFK